ncbi:unnamed protein product [Bemisia tabaci]|uniref:UDP-glucuronosyltransferase n=1 Tax=Bemisia tabaci TaxID=7038 RepID=A0A9P0A5Z5_BEMTA|nr:unnamed protein product [Bemisia tabaci]
MKRTSSPNQRTSILWMILFHFTLFRYSDCFKVLFLFPLTTKSHFGAHSVLAEELARRGHEVTVLSHFHKEKANYKEIIMDSDRHRNLSTMKEFNATKFQQDSPLITRFFTYMYFSSQVELCMSSQEILELVKSNEHYDVIVGEVGFFQPFIVALGHKFSAPVVDIFPSSPFPHDFNNMGSPISFPSIPDPLLSFSDEMSFMERLENTVTGLWDLAIFHWYLLPSQEKLVREHFKYPGADSMPPLSSMIKNISLMLVNSHFSIEYSRPLVSNVIEVGGMHINPAQKLPQDLQTFLDEAELGVIYISFGSIVTGTMLGEYRAQQIANALKRLKYRVIIKWDDTTLFEGDQNIVTLSWAPQQEILAHPKLLLFVTHGGFNSLIEATHMGVPVLGIPVFADQFHNIRIIELRGIGRGLDLAFTSDQLYDSIIHIVQTPSYRDNAKEISRRTRDRPLSALDTAIFWIEYVVRHKGASHLKSSSRHLPFHQYLLLDVICFVFLVIFVTCKIISAILCKLCHKKTRIARKKRD